MSVNFNDLVEFDLDPEETVLVVQPYSQAQLDSIAHDTTLSVEAQSAIMDQFYEENLTKDPDLKGFLTLLQQLAKQHQLVGVSLSNKLIMLSGDEEDLIAVRDLLTPQYCTETCTYGEFCADFEEILGDQDVEFGVQSSSLGDNDDDDYRPSLAPGGGYLH